MAIQIGSPKNVLLNWEYGNTISIILTFLQCVSTLDASNKYSSVISVSAISGYWDGFN